ncbi:PD-(D/E)XK motif protein [Thioalkalivibrio sp. ALJ24]|uniref:PD-(D/E)XK motif protein n=1 Tax=Thioalkalivibrio sp. ALJ24 TaxID=545276 RepID=UPI002100FB10|nr:PD-(D/E)XK motif protein [Thioalkalivibrio sp. ALJ24]
MPSLALPARTDAGQIRLAVGPNGEARLLVPLARDDSLQSMEAGPALLISVSTLMHKGRASRFMDLMCLSSELETVFGDVVSEILARIAAGANVSQATSETIEDFRALLIPHSHRDIERHRVAGLVGELVILNRLLDLSPSAWRAWQGPAGDRHDFRVRDNSLEVKASLRAGVSVITINGLAQLEPPSDGSLHLLHLVLEPADGSLLSVAALGGQALSKADNPSGLRELLLSVGCSDILDERWNRHTFRLEGEKLYSVSVDFPRIAPSCFEGGDVPAGVVDATYEIDLGFAESCRRPPTEVDELLREFAR